MSGELMRIPSCLLLMAAVTMLGGGCHSEFRRIREYSSHGSLRVGQLIPGFSGVTDTGQSFDFLAPWTNLTVYSVADTHPCLSVDIGEAVPSLRARKMGIRLIRVGDGKVAKSFGMKVVAGEPFRYDTTMVVLCDTNCQILRIWKWATVDDLDELLSQIGAQH